MDDLETGEHSYLLQSDWNRIAVTEKQKASPGNSVHWLAIAQIIFMRGKEEHRKENTWDHKKERMVVAVRKMCHLALQI